MAPRFFDIHAHVWDPSFNDDRNAVLARMQEKGVAAIMVGTDFKSSQDCAMMASFVDEGVFACIGVHPIDMRSERFLDFLFEDLTKAKRVVAVGECGLDYSRLPTAVSVQAGVPEVSDVAVEKERQRKLFEMQIEFAVAHDLPLMIHCRDSDKELADAHRDILAVLTERKKSAGQTLRGNIHFFSQTIDIAREYFALDFTISFTGVITFSREYDEVIRLAPLDHIMTETDSPYVAPIPYRGNRNEPIYVEEVVKKIAEIRNEDFETVRNATVANALRVFNITP
jgi:TatD DNase family protein